MRDYAFAIGSLTMLVGTSCATASVGLPSGGEAASVSARSISTFSYSEILLHNFKGKPDAANPEAGVVRDAGGDLYGTTIGGGALCPGGYGARCGTVYEIDTAGREHVVYSFTGRPDANQTLADVTLKYGNIYGTSAGGGGGYACYASEHDGCGTIFKIDRHGDETLLYKFMGNFGTGKADGENPEGGLVADSSGNFYGTTTNGGRHQYGTIFKITKEGKESVLYSFSGGADGEHPYAGLVRDAAGNLYGDTYVGGSAEFGTIFEFKGGRGLTTLYTFKGKRDGGNPMGALVRDDAGDLFGTASSHGDAQCHDLGSITGCGTVFELEPTHRFKVLHVFAGPDGAIPEDTLVRDSKNDLYGTASYGGDAKCNTGLGCGVVFEVDSQGRETTLHTFTGGPKDGAFPFSGVTRDAAGNLYGTTFWGGTGACYQGCGVVFELKPRA